MACFAERFLVQLYSPLHVAYRLNLNPSPSYDKHGFRCRILAQVHPSLSVLCMALTEYLVKGVLSRYCRFLNKGVGVESSEKLMKELSDPSPRLGPNPKNNLNSNTSERNGQSRILYHHPSNLLASLLFYISELISQIHNTTTTANYQTCNI